jgi:transcription elongation factor GreA
MTQEGYSKLMDETKELEKQRPGIKKAIEEAREKGDLRENADYHAAREDLAMLNARLSDINDKLSRAIIIDPSKNADGKITLGHTVTLKKVSDGKEIKRTLVGEGEANVVQGKILTTSPIGSALMGQAKGDVVTVTLPKGPEEFEIVDVS